jgi:cytochrome c-type biogenesis protein CcmH/NrfG
MDALTLILTIWTVLTAVMAVWTYRQGMTSRASALAILALIALILIVFIPSQQSLPTDHPPMSKPMPTPIQDREDLSEPKTESTAAPDINKMVSSLATRLETDTNDVDGHRMLARSYYVQGDYQKSIDTYLHVLALMPNDVESMTLLVEVMLERDEGELGPAALYWTQQAQSRQPMNPNVLWLAGLAAYQQQQTDIALAHWEALLPMLVGQPDYEKLATMIEQIKPAAD